MSDHDSTHSLPVLGTIGAETASVGRPASDADVTVPAAGPSPAGDFPAIPGYEILGKLGQGGMAVVYRARQLGLNRDVAVKMVRPDDIDGRGVIRFLAEAEAAAAVDHPHVIRVFDYGQADGRPYLAMEYLRGGTLADRLGQPMPPREAAALVAKLAAGIGAAHTAGIVHRDLKPANVLFDTAGEPKVADFGLAKRGTGADLTHTGAVMGTPAYMAPEQARGNTRLAGPAADIWALGVILYECLTGKRPFSGEDTGAVLHAVQTHDPAPPRRVNPAVPRDLELVCQKCLEKEVNDRYLSANELTNDLMRFINGEPVAVRPASVVIKTWKWAKRNPGVATAAIVTCLTLMIGSISSATFGVYARQEADRANRQEQATSTALTQVSEQKSKADEALIQVTEEQGRTRAALNQMKVEQRRSLDTLKAMTDSVLGEYFITQQGLGDEEKAFFRKVLTLYQQALGTQDPTPESRFRLADGNFRMALLEELIGDRNAAETRYKATQDQWRGLVAENSESVDYREGLAKTLVSLGRLQAAGGRSTEAEASLVEARDQLHKLAIECPDLKYRNSLGNAHYRLGDFLLAAGRLQESARELTAARDLYSKLLDEAKGVVDYRRMLAEVRTRLSDALSPKSSEQALQEVISSRGLWMGLVLEYPEITRYRARLIVARIKTGNLMIALGRHKEGRAELDDASAGDISRAGFGRPFSPSGLAFPDLAPGTIATYQADPGSIASIGRYPWQGLPFGGRSLVPGPPIPGGYGPSNPGPFAPDRPVEIARIKEAGLVAAKNAWLRLSTELPNSPSYDMELADARNNLAVFWMSSGRLKEAEAELVAAWDGLERILSTVTASPTVHNLLSGVLNNLAIITIKHGKLDHARRLVEIAHPHHLSALRSNPKNQVYRRFFRNHCSIQIDIFISSADHASVPDCLTDYLANQESNEDASMFAAVIMAKCVTLAERDNTKSGPQRSELARLYAVQAVRYLSQAMAKGWKVEQVRGVKEFDSLRNRADYKRLVQGNNNPPELAPPPRPVGR